MVATTTPTLQSTRFATGDGLTLAVDIYGDDQRPTLLFAHGFGQTRGAWRATARSLAGEGYRCVTFDSRGHGESDRVPAGEYHMEQFVSDVVQLAHAQPDKPVLVGASMGGLLALVVAGEIDPSAFRALVLVDITPRWESAGVERILAFMQAHPDGFLNYEDAAEQISKYLPHRAGRKSEEQLRPLLREGADGRLRWHWDPALLGGLVSESERYQPRLMSAAAKVQVPVLLLSGGRSDVVSSDTVQEFLQLVPHAEHVELSRATHMVAGDANDAFTQEIARFVRQLA
ncbi:MULTISPECIES: alpha/beta fold hydrolase [Dyella]|uniref:Alpha/beta hydrolase n=2 Tax=Dyella TaxID=231454 RepID=A0A4V2NM64_9GAMM|nr:MULTISPECIES: alpha/beta hydrolase [Dyella]TBR40321.1 alpha/beta hydrolase [Dyella terrae]TCI12097.1 alpha/beta hydrolase [Dyella soli]